uniref:Uncharacterized protein n=1 Tax=Arundo donax TaxID=35708 RepID=A0A0A9BFD7_ARUDO
MSIMFRQTNPMFRRIFSQRA